VRTVRPSGVVSGDGVAHAGWSQEDDVASFFDEAQGRQLGDLLAIQGGLEVEVEVL
jgi:hypothetical protein